MKRLADLLFVCNRLQQTQFFKIVATVIVLLASIVAVIAYSVTISRSQGSVINTDALDIDEAAPAQGEAAQNSEEQNPEEDPREAAARKAMQTDLRATATIINDILGAKQSVSGFMMIVAILAAVALVIIWLGLALTYLGLLILAGALAWFFMLIGRGRDLGVLSVGLISLIAAFAAIMQALRVLFSGSNPVMAVAKNVLSEALRMKISLVFIVLLVFGLAALPLLLDPASPLRYRVQSFLQWGTAGSFWAIAILVLTFSVATVATEQRDKLIWQTMTKPVRPWQYILGKWLGVSAIAAALLAVSASGVFIFVEYLRNQPATGESEAYVSRGGQGITEDRLILETQVLTARSTRLPAPIELDAEAFKKNVQDRVERELRNLEQNISSPDELRREQERLRRTVAESLTKSIEFEYRAIEPGSGRVYRFENLNEAKSSNRPIILRFKMDSGSNRPDAEFRITLQFSGSGAQEIPIGLGQFHTIPVNPTVIDKDGNADLTIMNMNAETIVFAPDALELSYTSGGFRANFIRCVIVLWIKLAFLAIMAITASTFLSFSIASLVSFTVFLAAEGAGFITSALENYSTEDNDGKILLLNTIAANIAGVVAQIFRVYSDLRPTARLVEGLELSMLQLMGGTIVLVGASAILFAMAVYIFRQRELAIYSGN